MTVREHRIRACMLPQKKEKERSEHACMLLVGYIFDQWKVCISVIVQLNKVNLLNCGVITLGLIGSSMLLGLVWLYILFATGPHMALGAPQEQELARLAR